MVAFEEHARAWLVVHAVLGAATVAVATHLVVWIRGYGRGRFGRHRAARGFAAVALCLYAAEFLVGNVLYPSYKVRVRAEYLDLPSAVADDIAARRKARALVDPSPPPPAPGGLSNVARAFDIKEHWAALGLALAAAACALAWAWDPRRDGGGATPFFVGAATGAAACAWIAALLGLWVTSYRAVGSP